MPLAGFQTEWVADIYGAWGSGHMNVMPVGPTGCGKTVVMSHIFSEYNYPSCAIAHRKELTSQMSMALARQRVPHRIIAPKDTRNMIVAMQMDELGFSMHNSQAPCGVAGVDSLQAPDKSIERWLKQCGLVAQDEGHHVLRDNKWGRAMAQFSPTARGLFPTAHALRADGKGLGRQASGLVDYLAITKNARELINEAYLCDYRVVCMKSDIDMSDVPIGASGEYVDVKLRAAVHRSRTIVGDVVDTYLKFCSGMLGITFAVDVEEAGKIAAAYRAKGVPAEVVTAKTHPTLRTNILKRFARREVLQLVNVDLFGEGYDCPGVEVVSMVRATASFQLFAQQFGRPLRLAITKAQRDAWEQYTIEQRKWIISQSGKPRAWIIDHVGNLVHHMGPPDSPRVYTLENSPKGERGRPVGAVPGRSCENPLCLQYYPRTEPCCPYCEQVPTPGGRGTPAQVDGDPYELTEAMLAQLRGDAEAIMRPPATSVYQSPEIAQRHQNTWQMRVQSQEALREAIALWAGYQAHLGRGDSESYRRFYFLFGIDVLSAMALKPADAGTLCAAIQSRLAVDNVVKAA
jgi:DNA repair protein RadD